MGRPNRVIEPWGGRNALALLRRRPCKARSHGERAQRRPHGHGRARNHISCSKGTGVRPALVYVESIWGIGLGIGLEFGREFGALRPRSSLAPIKLHPIELHPIELHSLRPAFPISTPAP